MDLVRGNFYIVYPKISSYLLMSLLNNYYTFYQLENLGKRYGKDLFKIQKYYLNKIKLPDVDKFSNKDKAKLEILGEKLSNQISNQEKTIIEISNVISNYSNISFEEINNSFKNLRNDRLGGG
ncbi:hypothetical protein NHG33_01000 [Aerococcaceae bacterium NML130460]|nr:hypothetical protein [Aerococcaceae bacterium NML130460]